MTRARVRYTTILSGKIARSLSCQIIQLLLHFFWLKREIAQVLEQLLKIGTFDQFSCIMTFGMTQISTIF